MDEIKDNLSILGFSFVWMFVTCEWKPMKTSMLTGKENTLFLCFLWTYCWSLQPALSEHVYVVSAIQKTIYLCLDECEVFSYF